MSECSCINEEYQLPDGTNGDERVNSLYEAAMRNDKNAEEEITNIILSSTSQMVSSKLVQAGLYTKENVENVKQDIADAISGIIFKGYDSKATEEGFFGYLNNTARNRVLKFIADASEIRKNEKSSEEEKVFEIIDNNGDMNHRIDKKWTEYVAKKIMKHYVEVLKNNTFPPYRVFVYCYAAIIPKMFRESKSVNFLKRIDEIYKRNKEVRSWYDEDSNSVKGEVCRDSDYLVKWAVAAMKGCKIAELDKEFISFYNMAPLLSGDNNFAWGAVFSEKLNGNYEKTKIPMKDLVITEQFTNSAISNYAQRVGAAFLKNVQKAVIEDSEIMEFDNELLFDILKKKK